MLTAIKEYLSKQQIDYLLLENTDEFFNEYLAKSQRRIEAITGFTGSNAKVIFGIKKSYFFTDGRYILQANNQLDKNEYEIFNIADESVLLWLEKNLKQKKIAIFTKLCSVDFVCKLERLSSKNIIFIDEIFIDQIWHQRSDNFQSQIFSLSLKSAGKTSLEKRKLVIEKTIGEALFITKPDELCWLLNIRATDLEHTPLLLTYGILYRDLQLDLFVDEKRVKHLNLENVSCIPFDCLDLRINSLRKIINQIEIDFEAINYFLFALFQKNNFIINNKKSAIQLQKSIKNDNEIEGIRKSHIQDGVALVKFILWFKKIIKKQAIDEVDAQEKLLEFRQQNRGFFSESFPAISGFAENSAIIHYRACQKTCKKIIGNSLYLIDSGGQYYDQDYIGTTDITRTLLVGNATAEMIRNYTLVLKGHLALARVKFPRGTTGQNLDSLARFNLWQFNLDYPHGTGHGVGAFLGVHEGPCAISSRNKTVLLENMVLSNEPGLYLENHYGIRIENLQRVMAINEKFFAFETLSLCPYEPDLIDFRMLTYPEKKWLANYHQKILIELSSYLDLKEVEELENVCKKFFN